MGDQYNGFYECYNLDGKYSGVEFDVGRMDGDDGDAAVLYIYVDGEVVQKIAVTGDVQTEHILVPVHYGHQMKIVQGGSGGSCGVANLRGIK